MSMLGYSGGLCYVMLLRRIVQRVYVRLLARTVGLVRRSVRMFFRTLDVDETVWDVSATLCWVAREDCAYMLDYS